ncbi:MAG TPA: MarR family transcriptional regulator [Pseudonocardiaceae bacterium]|jgi:DNA-binding MarR family transcriptional regulator|nr:MarR family transcriptional regulator [Pseudonocardiaceae bacterium]
MTESAGARLQAALGLLLLRRHRTQLYGELLEPFADKVDEATYPVLSGLARVGPTTAAKLAHDVGLDRSVVSRHSDRLEALGLLRRSPDPADARATLLTLTEDGTALVARLRDRLAGIFQQRLERWPADQADAFVAGMERFVAEYLD